MYSDEFVRQLCQDVAAEEDPTKTQELISLLRAVLKDDQEEIRIRMAFLTKQYSDALSASKATD